MGKSKIEWTDYTWNPVTGCTKISPGCKNCYAERIAMRFWDRLFTKVLCHPERLGEVERIEKPQKIFVCSMSDLFHEDVSGEFIEQVFYTMAKARRHTFIILTKRPARMMEFMNGHHECVQDNVWLGVSVENQRMADERIPILLQTPASKRFVSVEPMLEHINIYRYLGNYGVRRVNNYCGYLDWVICGAESGVGARPFDMNWAWVLMRLCYLANLPFFFKQGRVNGRLVKMPELDGKVWAEYPA